MYHLTMQRAQIRRTFDQNAHMYDLEWMLHFLVLNQIHSSYLLLFAYKLNF